MHRIIILIVFYIKCTESAKDYSDYDGYDYSEPDIKKDKKVEGSDRLINAAAAKTNDFPFVGAFFIGSHEKIIKPQCSAALISPDFALSAAHCFYFEKQMPTQNCNKQPIKIKKEPFPSQDVQCEVLKNGDVKLWIDPATDKAYILFNAGDAKKRKDGTHDQTGVKEEVKYFIRPFDSYDNTDGNIYHDRGGQDILLMKLVKKSTITPACLPGPKFQDTEVKSHLAGYGKYFRKTCQTSSKGPMKYHYCITDPDCNNTFDFENCKPEFTDGLGKTYSGCEKSEKTPAQWSRLCAKFMYQSDYKFAAGVDEVHLLQLSSNSPGDGKFLETCYRVQPGELGWCRTGRNLYNEDSTENETRIATDWGWGFCSVDCHQKGGQNDAIGILRELYADVFSEAFCTQLLDNLKINGKDFKYRPKILCVGKNIPLRYDVFYSENAAKETSKWFKVDEQFLNTNPQITKEIYKKNMVDPDGDGSYMSAIGSCRGDSGGPMFLQRPNKITGMMQFVLTGLTSGGRSKHGSECGGMNNPTIYVRVKQLVDWILNNIQKEYQKDVCIHDL